eukprot:10361418-Heterocapsa_arctica.AAC.1
MPWTRTNPRCACPTSRSCRPFPTTSFRRRRSSACQAASWVTSRPATAPSSCQTAAPWSAATRSSA